MKPLTTPLADRPMWRLFRYLTHYRRKFTLTVGYSIINKILDMMPPILTAWLLDSLMGQGPSWLMPGDNWSHALQIALLIVAIFLGESFFEWLYQLGFRILAQQVQHDLRLDAYSHLQNREIAFFERSRTGNLLAILNDDINQLERFLNSGFNELLHIFILIIFASIALFAENWQMALVGVSAIPFIIGGSLLYQKLIAPRYSRMREAVGELSNRLENNLSGIMVIKSFGTESYERKRVQEVSEEYKSANIHAIRLNSAYIPVIRIFITFGFAGSLLLGSYWFLEGKEGITLGSLAMFAMMIQRLLWPVTGLGRILDDFERARASAKRIFGLLDSDKELDTSVSTLAPASFQGEVKVQDVSFHYQPDLPILQHVNFHIPAGQTIGIAGPTGAGKTTLIKLLLRLYDVTDGSILLDGLDIKQFDLAYLRQHIALVSQDTYLFHGTIRENIAYGKPSASLEAVMDAAQKAQLHDFVAGLPDGYEAIVGERGIKLSGGQRQRLSIARAILKDAPLLILDEATSAVDSETERAIQESLTQLTVGRTAIIIAHRLSTIRNADAILVFRNGKLVERGTHEELLAAQDTYAELWRVQSM